MLAEFMYAPLIENFDQSKSKIKKLKSQGILQMTDWLNNEVKLKRTDLSVQLKWWEHAQTLKESGFYVQYNNQTWHSPNKIKKQDYNKTKKYVTEFLQTVINLGKIDFEMEPFKEMSVKIKDVIKNIPT